MQSAAWLLLEQQISAGDFIPVGIGFGESNRSTNAESEGETEPGRPGQKRTRCPFLFTFKMLFVHREGFFSCHGLVPSLNGLVTTGCVRPGGASAAHCTHSLAVEVTAFTSSFCPTNSNGKQPTDNEAEIIQRKIQSFFFLTNPLRLPGLWPPS